MAAEYATTAPVETYPLYMAADHLGNTRCVTNASGGQQQCFDYFPFGEETVSGTFGRSSCFPPGVYPINRARMFCRRSLPAKNAIETGLDFFGVRYFSGSQGRFSSPDPDRAGAIGYEPQSWNMYARGFNNPLRFNDPTRHCRRDAHFNKTNSTSVQDDEPPSALFLAVAHGVQAASPVIDLRFIAYGIYGGSTALITLGGRATLVGAALAKLSGTPREKVGHAIDFANKMAGTGQENTAVLQELFQQIQSSSGGS